MSEIGGQKKWGILAWQAMEQKAHSVFPVAWDNIALRLIQIARGFNVWIIDLMEIKGKLFIDGNETIMTLHTYSVSKRIGTSFNVVGYNQGWSRCRSRHCPYLERSQDGHEEHSRCWMYGEVTVGAQIQPDPIWEPFAQNQRS
jgi:hypothetical protein